MLELRDRMMVSKTRGDRGEGAVSYIAVIILIAAILGAISVSGIGTKIANGIGTAIDKVTSATPKS
ncbi:hypothetical protein DPM19_15800 [Actinomadura craniellae]|uniref:Uncharacterized protein n=1 Tax=Actinomadura craniellae TaxID=2231787 RepID=A0A365H5N7_9ACTN|nr:hypothetical protein [Actinomadura craniellae]RAY14420.1 hypothetical protein DPM19_15800 [Actinomadura craniellae]